MLIDDVVDNLSVIVRRDHRIVAAFARKSRHPCAALCRVGPRAIIWGKGIRCNRAPSPWLLSIYVSNECCSDSERAVGYCQRQCR
jgi:hypothetical protein